jgi:hypothetical protein
MTTNLLLLFASMGVISTAFILRIIILDIIRIGRKKAEATRFELPNVNDIPNWQPLNPVAKRSNAELKKMYKGNMRGDLV